MRASLPHLPSLLAEKAAPKLRHLAAKLQQQSQFKVSSTACATVCISAVDVIIACKGSRYACSLLCKVMTCLVPKSSTISRR